MARSMQFIFKDNPIPLARPRFSHHHAWDSQKQKKLHAGIQLVTQFGDSPFFKGPLIVEFIFHFSLPSRTTAASKIRRMGTPHITTPDLDNCVKFYLDCSQGILFENDCMVVQIAAKKIYSQPPHTIMIITEML